MVITTKQPLSEKIQRARNLFTHLVEDEEIRRTLAEYGYDANRIEEGRTLLERLEILQDTQQREYGEQYASSLQFRQLREEADATFERLWQAAQLAVADEPALRSALNLAVSRKRLSGALDEWLAQAGTFYRRLLDSPAMRERLAVLRVTPEQLQAGLAQCQAVQEASARQQKEKTEAQEATRLRNEAATDLQKWVTSLTATARFALAGKPQKLQLLGIKP